MQGGSLLMRVTNKATMTASTPTASLSSCQFAGGRKTEEEEEEEEEEPPDAKKGRE